MGVGGRDVFEREGAVEYRADRAIVREAAQRRLLEAADPVAAQLVELALHAHDPRVQLAAIRDLLNRAGIAAPTQLEITVEATMKRLDAEILRLSAELGEPIPPGLT